MGYRNRSVYTQKVCHVAEFVSAVWVAHLHFATGELQKEKFEQALSSNKMQREVELLERKVLISHIRFLESLVNCRQL